MEDTVGSKISLCLASLDKFLAFGGEAEVHAYSFILGRGLASQGAEFEAI